MAARGAVLSTGAALVLLAAFSINLTNVATPFVYVAGGNPQTYIVLRNLAFLVLCGLWLVVGGRFSWLDRYGQLVCFDAGVAYTCGAGGLLLSLLYLPVSLAILVFFTIALAVGPRDEALGGGKLTGAAVVLAAVYASQRLLTRRPAGPPV